MTKRVVITGMGIVSCIGNDVETFRESLFSGKCGIERITEIPVDELAIKIGGKIRDFDPQKYGIGKPFVRKQDMFSVYAMAAANQAMADSALESGSNIDPYRLGVYMGSGIGGIQTIQRECEKLFQDRSGQWISPNFIPTMIGNIGAGLISMHHNARGSSLDIVTACATSTTTIGEAYKAIRYGDADAIIAGGSEHSTIPLGLCGFGNARTLSRSANPKYSSLPFNLNRDGFVMSDGAAALILEEHEHALARGARIYAEIVGYGSSSDAYNPTSPRPDGSTQAMCLKSCAKQAELDPDKDVVYINAHGTGTVLNDKAETLAYKLAFGDFAYKCHISSTKSMHGHMLGATGCAEAIAAILSLKHGICPPTINLDTPDPECDLDYTPNKAVRAEITLALSDSFGFGGHNACVAFRKIN